MSNKGRFMYVPPELISELDDIRVNFRVDKKADCMRIIAHNSKIAREIKLNLDFGFNKKKRK